MLLVCIVWDFNFRCCLTWFSFFQSDNLTFNYFFLRYIYVAEGLTIEETWIVFFFFLSIEEAWALTYWVNCFAYGFVAFWYYFFIVGCDTSFLDCFEGLGETYL